MEAIRVTLSEHTAARISLLYDVAKSQGSLISLKELVPLLPERTTERELVEAFSSFPSLGSRFELKGGFVTEKKGNSGGDVLLQTEQTSRGEAARNISYAVQFVPMLNSVPFPIVGVSGSTSFLSVSNSRDLDLFCVAPQGRMWSSLARALIFARIFSLTRPAAPEICLSCVMDEAYAESAFSKKQDPLFARDALATIVLRGGDTYRSLMNRATWISNIYPAAYSQREASPIKAPRRRRPNAVETVLNRFLYLIVGSYIKMKGSLLNRKLARHERRSVFTIRAGYDHLIYESVRYVGLRHRYAAVRAEETNVQN
jgi:hypothetical protein